MNTDELRNSLNAEDKKEEDSKSFCLSYNVAYQDGKCVHYEKINKPEEFVEINISKEMSIALKKELS